MQTNGFKAAAVQAAPVFMNMAGCVEKAIGLIDKAAAEGVKLIGFPETWIPGCPWWIWLGTPAWGLQHVSSYHANSMRVDGPEMKALGAAAKRGKINVVMGFSEIDGASLYMAQALIGDDGEVKFARRKLKPTHVERSVFGECDGSDFKVVDTSCGRVGALSPEAYRRSRRQSPPSQHDTVPQRKDRQYSSQYRRSSLVTMRSCPDNACL